MSFDSDPGTALVRRGGVDPKAALAILNEGPRTLVPEVEARLSYVRALRGALAVGLGTMFGGMALSIVLMSMKLVIVGMPLMFASVGAFLLSPLPKRAQARRLYTDGSVTRGRLLQARSENGSLFVTYVFRHDDRDYRGYLMTNDALVANRVGPDTPVFVFFDPKDPRRNAGLLPDELPVELRERASAG
jgi:hypothetical protein